VNHQNQRQSQDQENLNLLRDLAGGQAYNPPTYTSIQEFTPSLPKLADISSAFAAAPPLPQPQYVPEAPYPRIYTKHYKKTILASL